MVQTGEGGFLDKSVEANIKRFDTRQADRPQGPPVDRAEALADKVYGLGRPNGLNEKVYDAIGNVRPATPAELAERLHKERKAIERQKEAEDSLGSL